MLVLYSQVRESAAQIVERVGDPRDGTSAHGSWLARLNNLTCFTCWFKPSWGSFLRFKYEKKKDEMDSTNRGERKTRREDVRLCYKTLTQEKYGQVPSRNDYQRRSVIQNRDIVASLFQMVATLFQHYNMCCAQIVVANRIV